MPWNLTTLRQPNELKHRVRAILSGLTSRPLPTDDMRPIANVDVPPLGVNTFFEQEVDEATIRRSMEMIRAGGFQWIRQQFAWYEIERPAKGQYVDSATGRSSWEKYDRIVSLAGEYGLKVLARIDTVPDWARPAGSTFTFPPGNVQDYADFVRTLVTRYKGKVQYYQLWNEPNLSFEWGNQNVSASAFVPLLQAGYSAAKAADAQAVDHRPRARPHHRPRAGQSQRYALPARDVRGRRQRLFRHYVNYGLWLAVRAGRPARRPLLAGQLLALRNCCARSWSNSATRPSRSGSPRSPGTPCPPRSPTSRSTDASRKTSRRATPCAACCACATSGRGQGPRSSGSSAAPPTRKRASSSTISAWSSRTSGRCRSTMPSARPRRGSTWCGAAGTRR